MSDLVKRLLELADPKEVDSIEREAADRIKALEDIEKSLVSDNVRQSVENDELRMKCAAKDAAALSLVQQRAAQAARIKALEAVIDRMVSVFDVPSNGTLPGAEQETINYAKRVRAGGDR
jgi:hypothetical protein